MPSKADVSDNSSDLLDDASDAKKVNFDRRLGSDSLDTQIIFYFTKVEDQFKR